MANVTLEQQLQRKILVIDGAMGTMIQRANLSAADFGGEAYEGCNEYLTLTAPHVIRRIHEAYLEAGADIIETNTFGATRIVLDEYGLGHLALELNIEAAKLAKQTAESFSTPDWPRFVAGSMGPTTKTLSVTGGATFEELVAAYEEQARGLLLGGVDLLLLETCQDTLNVKAGFLGISKAFEAVGRRVPLMISGTIEPMGTTLAGQAIDAFFISVRHMKPIAVGLNCATGPEFMTDHLRTLASLADTAVSCYPNAGLPDEEGRYHETPEMLAEKIRRFAEKGWINIVGGCCGTTPDHIRAIAEAVRDLPPRAIPSSFDVHAVSGIEALIYDETMRPLFVGERTNVIGSRKFKRLIAEGKYEEAAEIARAQVKNGAHVIDICLADPDRDELHDMEQFVREVVKKVKVPLVIDSTDERVIERALTYSQGKAIINSINLEDGEERFAKVVPLLHKYGAAVVVGTIDEQGMAVTAERKLEIALRSYDLLVNRYGVPARDIIFDPLVFPVGTGDEQYIGAANETIKGIRLIKERLPHCLTMLGISNVSFGLPPAGREVLNSVFLYRCTQAGLDYAIVNTEKLERFASIPEEEVRMAEALLFDTSDETLNTFIEFYRSKITAAKPAEENLSLEERLARYVIEGSKDGLIPDLEKALETYSDPLSIINGPLMAGMDEVGRLFNNNQLIVAEVLQSAEVMKAAVAFLEPYMEKKEGSTKGKVILATVKGDVHDIGKNLVDIILSNNGYEVIDLGIKVAPQQLIEAVREHQPDIIGLSGLLVKSAQQMVVTAQDLRQAGISTPILVGGAALTRKFTENKIAPEYDGVVLYAKDAMDGLALANQIQQGEIDYKKKETAESEPTRPTAVAATVKSNVSTDVPVYIPADLERHVLRNVPLDHVLPYVNWQMVLGHHLGLKGKVKRLLEEKDEKALALKAVVDELVAEAKERGWIQPAGVYRFFPAQSDGNRVYVYDPVDRKTVLETFDFPRQPRAPYLCLADYLKSKESGEMDYVGLFAVTAGHGVRELAQRWKEEGEFLKSHAIQALALEIAEGFAERIHQIMRDRWGFPDDPDFTMEERFAAKYQGQRYSFGYPACPNLEDQEKLFRLLHPEDIGIRLTDGYMMEPEASVSAIVFAHPEARYFNVL
ncbi:methionine synthase [Geobacillus stearothermophilus]|uniref:Methionine synthase n=1 Tax=Geobacillus stearothermophilus TaxID=1422 RepID=A0A150MS64_GEOSE|nr:methionine synthase [Geobacillus stearothermophilus]KYD27165.1 5-methyltetrahydrofolate--homocysteine methyltransferase [Geobacillus stearothermophilus]MED3777616.1 methionine synthase [Geobacillus stearothermophilus]MED4332687.1 methionine synthase [Geobacillus stearothermophilus]MED4831731.1 methionine synthase [Geobacillus stearothermophilus]MED4961595.1 methionine synthase [Geobacillus stearothermophilus]